MYKQQEMNTKVIVVTRWLKTEWLGQVPIDTWTKGADTAEWQLRTEFIEVNFLGDRKEPNGDEFYRYKI